MLLVLLTGCSAANILDKTEKYEGEELRIGIVGNIPEIRESQVKFEEIDFGFLNDDSLDSKYDAIFITKENLSEASDAEYVSIYKKSEIPFYFIDNEKSHVNFIKEDLAYEDEPAWEDGAYITGLLYTKNKYWGYGLYNDTESEINIKGVYSRVFEDISEIKNNKLP
ncbi:MAG: transcription elongation factor GreAB [Eubacteriales bacterium]|nr:transcription elongation factor GreAB [Eubacteriales bacterium]